MKNDLMTFSGLRKSLLIIAAIFAVLILINLTGIIGETSTGCLIKYWALMSSSIILIGYWKRRWREYILVFSSTLITMIILECTLRYFFPYKAMMPYKEVTSSKYHHRPCANKIEMVANQYRDVQTTCLINEDYLRTKYSRKEFLTYKDRIVVLGDSFVFGSMLKQEWTVPEIMEKYLREFRQRDDIAVLNAGICSYSPFLEDLLYSNVVHYYNPTLVMLLLDATDIGDDYKYQLEARHDGKNYYFELPDKEIKYYGALHTIATPIINRVIKYIQYPFVGWVPDTSVSPLSYNYYNFEVTIDNTTETNRYFIYRHPLEKTRSYFLNTLNHISNIAKKVQQSGGRFILIIAPRYQHWNKNECPECWEKDEYALDEPFQYEYFRFFEELKNKVDFDILSLLPAFQTTDEFPLVYGFDPHWNKEGAAFTARTIAEYVLREKVVE